MSNPGSEYAVKHGCTCPVMDNNYGTRPPWPPDGWWIDPTCPLHGPKDIEPIDGETP